MTDKPPDIHDVLDALHRQDRRMTVIAETVITILSGLVALGVFGVVALQPNFTHHWIAWLCAGLLAVGAG
jgi:hypothetical protein